MLLSPISSKPMSINDASNSPSPEANATVVKGSEHKKAFARSNQLIKESPSQRKKADRVEVPNVRLVTDFRNRADSADRISHWSGAITRVVLGELSIK